MKATKTLALIAILAAALMGALAAHADDKSTNSVVPYPLDTCAVCGMKLGDMGKPYVFVYQGREIKVCDKSEQADFMKDPAKYLKAIDDAAKAKAKTDDKK